VFSVYLHVFVLVFRCYCLVGKFEGDIRVVVYLTLEIQSISFANDID
jgi:hypothetical protein